LDVESLLWISFFRLLVKNVDEWSIAHLELDPSQNLAGPEGLKVFVNGNLAFIDIIGCAELAWHGDEIVDKDEMQRKCPRLLLLREQVELNALLTGTIYQIENGGVLLINHWDPSLFRYYYGVNALPLCVNHVDLVVSGVEPVLLMIEEVPSLPEGLDHHL
jgi:hypothetical protein